MTKHKFTAGYVLAGVALVAVLLQTMATGYTAQEFLDNTTNCTMIARYVNNGVTGSFETHIDSIPTYNFNVTVGNGYFVNCGGNETYSASGTAPGSVMSNLVTGWNLLGWVSTTSNSTAQGVLNGIGNTTATMIARYVNTGSGTAQFETHISGIPTYEFAVQAGEGYFINVNANTTWTR